MGRFTPPPTAQIPLVSGAAATVVSSSLLVSWTEVESLTDTPKDRGMSRPVRFTASLTSKPVPRCRNTRSAIPSWVPNPKRRFWKLGRERSERTDQRSFSLCTRSKAIPSAGVNGSGTEL